MTLSQQISHIITDLKRMNVQFPKRVAEGKMSQQSAREQIELHTAVLDTLMRAAVAEQNKTNFAPMRGRLDLAQECVS